MDKEDVVHIYNLMLLNIKKNEIMPWMDLESVILSEVSQTQEKYHVTSFICGIYKNELIYKTEIDSYRLMRTNLMVASVKDGVKG